jgi:hypothetical protein
MYSLRQTPEPSQEFSQISATSLRKRRDAGRGTGSGSRPP